MDFTAAYRMNRRLGMPRPFRTSGKGGIFGPQGTAKKLKRRHGQKGLHFITCSCYRRLPLFRSARARNLFVKILDEVRRQYGFAVMGYETRRESKTPRLQIKAWGTHPRFPERQNFDRGCATRRASVRSVVTSPATELFG